MSKELNIVFEEYYWKCGDGCCDHYGTVTTINEVELPCHNQDYGTIVEQILRHLGYEVKVEYKYDEPEEG